MSELSINQPEDAHQVTVTQDDEGYLVRCNECMRIFRIGHNGTFEVLVKGDMMAHHSFGTGGLMPQGVSVRTEGDDNVERLLRDLDIGKD